MIELKLHRSAGKSVREAVYDTLKQAIISGEITRGTRIIETEYADMLHISRTPLREALRKLQDDGLLEYVANKGVFVKSFTIEDVEEIYTIRNSLEMLTINQIIKNATEEDVVHLKGMLAEMDILMESGSLEELLKVARAFHTYIVQISKLARVISSISYHEEYIHNFSLIGIQKEPRKQEAHDEHYQIVDCIARRNEDALRGTVQKHIEHSKEMCLLALKEQNRLVSRS